MPVLIPETVPRCLLSLTQALGQLGNMNRWQIVCPAVVICVVAASLVFIQGLRNRVAHLVAASHAIGQDLIAETNSARLVKVGPNLHAKLCEVLRSRTQVARVLVGDAQEPFGDGRACTRLLLTNDAGQAVCIRLMQDGRTETFHVLGFQGASK